MLADQLAAAAGLELAGVMAVAPLGGSPEAAFEKLAAISASLVAEHPGGHSHLGGHEPGP